MFRRLVLWAIALHLAVSLITSTLSAEESQTSLDTSAWPADDKEIGNTPVDLSFLNAAERSAGKRG